MLVKLALAEHGSRVRYEEVSWGESDLAARHGITEYPAIFVGEQPIALPNDLGYVGGTGRYTPIADPERRAALRRDVGEAVRRALAGEPLGELVRQAVPEPEQATLPRFRVQDRAGAWVDSAELAGRTVVLELWASWCPSCRRALQHLDELAARDELTVLPVGIESAPAELDAVLASVAPGLTAIEATPELLDALAALGTVASVPTTFVFAPDGRLVGRLRGAPADFETQLAELLAAAAKR